MGISVAVAGAIAAAVAAAAAAAGTATSIVSQQRAAAARARQAENNARIAEFQKSDAIQRGAFEARRRVIQGRRVASRAEALIGVSGVEATGSALNPLQRIAVNASLDAQTIKANAARAAWGFGVQSSNLLDQARDVRQAGILGSIGTGISGAASVAGQAAGAIGK